MLYLAAVFDTACASLAAEVVAEAAGEAAAIPPAARAAAPTAEAGFFFLQIAFRNVVPIEWINSMDRISLPPVDKTIRPWLPG